MLKINKRKRVHEETFGVEFVYNGFGPPFTQPDPT